jgi:hypothetical protein
MYMRFRVLLVLAALTFVKGAFAIPNTELHETYQPIIERNSFGLKPPQVVTPPVTNKPPENKNKVEIFLTGYTSIGYPKIPKRAYLMVKEQNKKEPAYYSLSEGQGRDGIEVLPGGIDELSKTVKIKWEEGVTLLSFATHGITNATPAVVAGNMPGRMGMPGQPGLPPPLTPGIPDPNAHHPGMNAQPGYGNQPNQFGEGGSPNTFNNPAATARQIPTRSVRVAPPLGGIPPVDTSLGGGGINPAPQAPIDPAQQYLQLRLQEESAKRQGIILPPTPPLP